MRCSNCGNENPENYRFCVRCGTPLEEPESEKTEYFRDEEDFENEKTVILDDEDTLNDAFENEKTVILDDTDDYVDDFENEKTVILEDPDGPGDRARTEETPPAVPSFDYRTVYREHRTIDDETAYIEHLRKLKGLLDDGIITEDEFTRKKQQILGI